MAFLGQDARNRRRCLIGSKYHDTALPQTKQLAGFRKNALKSKKKEKKLKRKQGEEIIKNLF